MSWFRKSVELVVPQKKSIETIIGNIESAIVELDTGIADKAEVNDGINSDISFMKERTQSQIDVLQDNCDRKHPSNH
jgi:hypothetical protein